MNISPANMANNIQMNNAASFNGVANVTASLKNSKASKFYNDMIEKAARKMVAPVLDNDNRFIKFLEKTAHITEMPNHLSTLGAAATSGFYVRSTLKNDKLEKKERQTLALNQALVFVVSTAGAYLANGKIGQFVEKVKHKYVQYNRNNPKAAVRIDGFKTASSLMVFALMYRYISPVVVTPIASAISKAVRERKEAKQADQANNVA